MRSFSQLRNEFADVDTFYLGTGSVLGVAGGIAASPARRSRSRGPPTVVEDISRQRRARSKSRPRALYAPDSEIVRVNGKKHGVTHNHVITDNYSIMARRFDWRVLKTTNVDRCPYQSRSYYSSSRNEKKISNIENGRLLESLSACVLFPEGSRLISPRYR